MKNLPDCFEKSLKSLKYILLIKLEYKMSDHDSFLNVPTSTYNDLIKAHLQNIKETFLDEVMD